MIPPSFSQHFPMDFPMDWPPGLPENGATAAGNAHGFPGRLRGKHAGTHGAHDVVTWWLVERWCLGITPYRSVRHINIYIYRYT